MQISQILDAKGPDVVTVEPETSVDEAVRILQFKRIGALVVTDQTGAVAGIISERDIVRGLAAHGAKLLEMPVRDLMTRSVVTCGRESLVEHLMKDMTVGRFRHLPVMEGDKLVGIISIGDVVKNRVEELESETSVLRDYVTSSR
jgi:CBS domain-containing protein